MSQTEPQVRCSICGKENPPGATACAYCGSRLGPSSQPTQPDSLDDLRAQLGLTPQDKKPTSPLKEPEPDFSYGANEEKSAPDWLSDILQTPFPAAPLQEEIPDWLQDIESPSPPQLASTPDEPPSWLKGLEKPASAQPSASTASSDLPDWLAKPSPTAPSASPSEEMPDWLKETAGPTMPVPPPAQPLDMPEAPDWLTRPSEPIMPTSLGEEKPDWLAEVEKSEPEAPPPSPTAGPPNEEEIPGWLKGIGEPETAPVPGKEPLPPTSPGSEAESNWLDQLGLTKPTGAESAAPQPSPSPDEVPDWLRDLIPSAPSSAPTKASPPPAVPEEDWISALGLKPSASEPLPPPVAPVPDTTIEQLEQHAEQHEATPEWLNLIDFSEQPSPALPIAGEDLLGLPIELAPPPTPTETEETPEELFSVADLPELLVESTTEREPTGESLQIEAAPELLAQIGDLRFEAITGQPLGKGETSPETVGALKDVTGVIRPELLFDGATLQTTSLVDGVVVTKEQSRRIELIQKLLAREAEGVSVSGKRRRALPLVRWLVSIVVAAAIIVPNMMGFTLLEPPIAQSGSAQAAYQIVEALPSEGLVLVAFEYEPDTAGEMQPLAQALLDHLAERPDLTVYAVSTRITGPAMAQSVFEQTAPASANDSEVHGRWINLGYISGEANGVSALTVGSSPGVPSPLAFDYLGRPTGITATRLTELPVDLIIVLASRADDLRIWVEQAGRPTSLPILAAMSAGAAPLVYPYQQSGQLVGVLSGINDAVAYRVVNGGSSVPSLTATWNAQANGALAAALAIALGSVIYGLATRREQQEQD